MLCTCVGHLLLVCCIVVVHKSGHGIYIYIYINIIQKLVTFGGIHLGILTAEKFTSIVLVKLDDFQAITVDRPSNPRIECPEVYLHPLTVTRRIHRDHNNITMPDGIGWRTVKSWWLGDGGDRTVRDYIIKVGREAAKVYIEYAL